ncbi:MAG: methyltransferase [Lachnospiraceae bacterium]|jgi:uroporphyrinogen-III decarboxylase|nr:methyltransferase [Lachnospiraceae bacterium]MCI1327531.1 methyltransferase [Lachnospiraceae bacterium]
MTSRERVLTAFAHQEPDQVPVDFGGMCTSMVNCQVVAQLRDYYGLEKKLPRINDMSTMTAYVDPDLGEAMGVDVQQLYNYGDTYGHINTEWKEWQYRGTPILIPKNATIGDDGKGGYYLYPEGDASCEPSGHMPADGYYFDNLERGEEVDEDDLNPEDNAEDYMPVSDAQIAYHKKMLAELKPLNRAIQCIVGYSCLGDANNVPGPNIKHPKGIRSIEEWYMAPLLYPDYVEEVFELGTDRAIRNFERYWNEFGSDIDIVYICGTDFGSQDSLMMSTDTFRELYLPYYKKMNDWIHEHTTWKTLKHSCGAIFDMLPLLIESGFDAINPVQCSAKGMDPRRLKDTYGKDILFWGGGVDTQKVLPFGTPAEVRAQVLGRLKIFSKGGGYIFNTIHNIQCNTPVENIVAMVDAVKEFNGTK